MIYHIDLNAEVQGGQQAGRWQLWQRGQGHKRADRTGGGDQAHEEGV